VNVLGQMGKLVLVSVACLGLATGCGDDSRDAASRSDGLDKIETIVVIYLENRSFDNLYGHFPGANGLAEAANEAAVQVDRDGTPLAELPPIWRGLTARGVVPAIGEEMTRGLPSRSFAIDDPRGFALGPDQRTRDLAHLFYRHQMQINGGRNDRFVAYGDSGALVMGHYDGSKLPLWDVARRYVLADRFFMGAFGGSYLNHIYLACACIPTYPDASKSAAEDMVAALGADGVSLELAPSSPRSALEGPPRFVTDNAKLTPDFFAVNTLQPPYQPSLVGPAPDGDTALADPTKPGALPPQADPTIGDLLSDRRISWAWYSGAWAAAQKDLATAREAQGFQTHHQPFNYFARFAPGTEARREHLRDAGIDGAKFVEAIDAGDLPQVSFYKPQGSLNGHADYADVLSCASHAAEIVARLERSPQWPHMLVIVTYDESGGFWDHASPPKGDRWGPGTRVPALIISPYARKGTVDHTLYDTGSILRFLIRRFDLPMLPGLALRDQSMLAAGSVKPGDLTGALDLPAVRP
jgi:acid phosphatase